jgi:hypothetical protein
MDIIFLSLGIRFIKIFLHFDQQLCRDSLKNLCQASEAPGPSPAIVPSDAIPLCKTSILMSLCFSPLQTGN